MLDTARLSTVNQGDVVLATPMPRRLTFDGLVLFALGVVIAASGFRFLRVELGGLLIHPYLFLLAPIMPLMLATRLFQMPARLLSSLAGFVCLYFIATFGAGIAGVALSEGLKMGAAVATIITTALLVRTWSNFTAGVLGLSLAAAVLAVVGVETDEQVAGMGKSAIDVANRNAYSLYALPAILLAGFLLLQQRQQSLFMKLLLFACLVFSVGGVIISLNRAGWLCTFLIALMLFIDRNIRGKWLMAVIAVGALGVAYYAYDSSNIERRLSQTLEDPERDVIRWLLLRACIEIGMEYPVFGVGPQELPYEIGSRLGWDGSNIVAHNAFAHVLAGCGVFCLALMLYIGWAMATWRLSPRPPPQLEYGFIRARKLLRMMLVLYAVRAMFTHEILFHPAFAMGIGLCVGLCIANTPQLRVVSRSSKMDAKLGYSV